MCKSKFPFIVIDAEGSGGGAIFCSSIQEARALAQEYHINSKRQQAIYSCVEVTYEDPSPVKFKKVDGVNEN